MKTGFLSLLIRHQNAETAWSLGYLTTGPGINIARQSVYLFHPFSAHRSLTRCRTPKAACSMWDGVTFLGIYPVVA